MDGFFKALSEFLESDLAKGHGWVILVAFIMCVCIAGVIMWVILVKIIVPKKSTKADRLEQINQELTTEIEKLNSQKADLEQQLKDAEDRNTLLKKDLENYKFEQSLKQPDDFHDKALETFIR